MSNAVAKELELRLSAWRLGFAGGGCCGALAGLVAALVLSPCEPTDAILLFTCLAMMLMFVAGCTIGGLYRTDAYNAANIQEAMRRSERPTRLTQYPSE